MAKPGSFGMCELCGSRKTKAAMVGHLRSCAGACDATKGPTSGLVQLRAQAKGGPLYWLDLEVRRDAKLGALDTFLRRVWLECCGHLSAFHVGGFTYSVYVDREYGYEPDERNMNHRIGDVVRSVGQRFDYEYDFGSTTELTLQVWGVREGVIGRSPVRLLARSEPPVWPCHICQKPATWVCVYCISEGNPFCCAVHTKEHGCEDEAFLPVVNSPRMGVCGYTGSV